MWGIRQHGGTRVGPAVGAGRPGPAVPGRGLVDRRHARATVADGLGSKGRTGFQVHSAVRPWKGTFGDVDRAARSLAGALRARGVGPGSVVVVQLPNWVEAGITFWAAAYLGAVVVPIVHFYGQRRSTTSSGSTSPDVVVTADRFGHSDYLATYSELLGTDGPAVAGGGRDARPRTCRLASTPFGSMLDHRTHRRSGRRSTPMPRPSSASPRGPPVTPRASSTPIAPSAARPANSTTCSPRAVRPRSSGHRSVTSSACSTPSCCRCCGSTRSTCSTCGTPARWSA